MLVRPLEVAVHEPDQAIELVRDFRQSHVNVSHAFFVQFHALRLQFLYRSLTALDLRHDYDGVLELSNHLLEVHLNVV